MDAVNVDAIEQIDLILTEPLYREQKQNHVSISDTEMEIAEIEVEVVGHVPYIIGMCSISDIEFPVYMNAREKLLR